jgi:hypothetical protein
MKIQKQYKKSITNFLRVKNYVRRKYNITPTQAGELVSASANYNINDKKDMYNVIDMLYRKGYHLEY